MDWEIFETEPARAGENMRQDALLLQDLGRREKPILHLYAWQRPSVTFGHFINPEKILNVQEAEKRGVDLARRPTGGGVVFHLWDLAFSVLIPAKSLLYSANTLENYQLINRVVQNIAKEWLGDCELTPDDATVQTQECTYFCMARPTKYDVILDGKKIAGAAQRKTKEGFLHQGTIALQQPEEEMLAALLPSPQVRRAMLQTTCPLLMQRDNLENGRRQLSQLLKQHFVKL